jgi:hypothetical protein
LGTRRSYVCQEKAWKSLPALTMGKMHINHKNLEDVRMRCLLKHAKIDLLPHELSRIARRDLLHALII